MRVEADRSVCIGAGMCALTAPGVFDQDELEGHVLLLSDQPTGENAEAARQAVSLCPSGALSLHEDESTGPSETRP
jgi:ferredoxin